MIYIQKYIDSFIYKKGHYKELQMKSGHGTISFKAAVIIGLQILNCSKH